MAPSFSKIDLPPAVSDELSGVLETGVEFEGNLSFHGSFHINGTVKGSVITPDLVVVGETGRVLGSIKAGVVIIYGKVEATIEAKYRVEFHRPAVFRGEMSTPSLKVEEGVLFEGTNKMISE